MTHELVYLYGFHAIMPVLTTHPERIVRLYVQENRHDQKITEALARAKAQKTAIAFVSRDHLTKLADGPQHQGIVAYCSPPKAYQENDLPRLLYGKEAPLILALDGVQDPHNLGACFRSADALGADILIAPKDRSTHITPVVSKVASGAAETVPFVQVVNLVRTLEKLKASGLWIYGAAAEAKRPLYQVDWTSPAVMVLGAEGKGLRRLTAEHCDELVNIPMQGHVASLNVSVAAGIFLFEASRQRHLSKATCT